LTALSSLGSLASGSAAIAKTINNANMGKKQLEESKWHNKKIESIKVGEGMFLKPYRKVYGLYLNPFRGNPKNLLLSYLKNLFKFRNFEFWSKVHFRGVFMRDSLQKTYFERKKLKPRW